MCKRRKIELRPQETYRRLGQVSEKDIMTAILNMLYELGCSGSHNGWFNVYEAVLGEWQKAHGDI